MDVAADHRAACIRIDEVSELRAQAREASTWRH
jgi:hypothetical protein